MIKITFPDNNVREFPAGVTGMEIAKSLSDRLAKEVLSITVNGQVLDLTRPITQDSTIKLHKWDDEEGKHAFWHSSAHLMAEALEVTFPGVKLGIGPAIESGFYYDIDLGDRSMTEADLIKVEEKMVELAREKQEYIRRDVSKDEALKTYTQKGDPYKVELINDLQDGTITFYTQGQFTDLCRGPHLPDTSYIKAVKLLSIAGAYWRGNEKTKCSPVFTASPSPRRSYSTSIL